MQNFKRIAEGEWKPSVELTWNDPIQDSLANECDTAKNWQGVSPRMPCVVVSFVRRSQAFAQFARACVRKYT